MSVACLVGGTLSSLDNAGFFDPDLVTIAQTDEGDGGNVDGGAVGAVTNSGGNVLITDTDNFGNTIAGMYIRCDFADNQHTDGRYKITTVNSDDSVVLDLAYSADENVEWKVGGAVPIQGGGAGTNYGLQEVLDDATIASAAAQDVDIYVAPEDSPEVLTSTIDIDTGGGSTSTVKRIWACDSSYAYNPAVNTDGTEDATAVTLTTTSNLTDGLVYFSSTIRFVDLYGFILDCDGDGAANADYAVRGDANSENYRIIDCILKDADFDGALVGGSSGHVSFVNCRIFDNAAGGIRYVSTSRGPMAVYGCKIYDNLGNPGISVGANNAIIMYCQIYGNTGDGILGVANADRITIANNTIYANTGHGIDLSDAGLTDIVCFNNTLVGNGIAAGGPFYGLNITGTPAQELAFMGYNHSSDNEDGHSSAAVSDADWEALYHGGNIAGDGAGGILIALIFTDAGNDDFTPVANGPLDGNGINSTHMGAVMPTSGAGGATSGVRNPLVGPVG